jgi:lactate permease
VSLGWLALLAMAPILLAAVLLVGLRWPAKWAMPAVYIATVVIALAAWGMAPRRVVAASAQGLILTA